MMDETLVIHYTVRCQYTGSINNQNDTPQITKFILFSEFPGISVIG